jgi:diaminopropionate ammonia-lyase
VVARLIETVNRRERAVPNPLFDAGFESEAPARDAMGVHGRLPGYALAPLIDLTGIASALDLERLWLKDESSRLGLPAFKILGASWAVISAVQHRLGITPGDWATLAELAELATPLRPITLACATDGNHGRAVARMARWLGFDAIILVPRDMAPARIEAIRSEGAEVRTIDGSYDEAVDASANLASNRCLVISDTAWPGYEDVPRWVIEGYSIILWEIDDALAGMGEPGPDLVAVQIGVGALAAAVVRHYRRPDVGSRPVIVGVEPTRAACMTASIEAGEPVQIPGQHDSIMSGLNCGVPSPLAWPVVSRGIDLFVAIEDERARQAMRDLAAAGIVAGECGAAGLAGLQTLRDLGQFPPGARRALIISSEGPTDPAAWQQIVQTNVQGHAPQIAREPS